MAKEKIYAPVSCKQQDFPNGGHCLKIGVNVEKFIAFMKQHANAKGYVNLAITERKSVGQYGDTHSVWLDTWEPKPKSETVDERPDPKRGEESQDSDSIPF